MTVILVALVAEVHHPEPGVDDHRTGAVHGDPGAVEVQPGGIGHPPGGHL